MHLQWSHSVIRCRDMEAMVAFYGEVLGMTVADRGPLAPTPDAPEIVFMTQSASDHHQIAFAQVRGPEDATSLDHMAFRVGSLADVREMMARVAAHPDVADGAPITHGNAISVYFQDPEGNRIEVFCDTPWHVQQPVVQGWDPGLSDEQVLADVEARFKDAPEFGPMEAYRERRSQEFGER